jgi:undecaprenyl-diphosphatase
MACCRRTAIPGIAGFLALRRRWWHLAAFAAAIVLSEVLIGSLKGIYDRARPPGSLVATSGASFPSGHAIAARSPSSRRSSP